jgi:hypothetical protein
VVSLRVRHEQLTRLDFHQLDCGLAGRYRGIVTRLDCIPFGVVVNKHTERFYDEGEDFWPKRYAIWGRLVAQQSDQIAYAIIDAKSIDLFMPSVFPPIKAGSIREMAANLELDPPALEQRVNAIFESLDDGEKEACKRIFLRLTQPGEGTEDTKRRASRQEFGESDTVDEVLHKIGEARLITMEGVTEPPEESFVEVSHEALIRGWNRLRDWIGDNRDDLRIQHRLSEAAKEWEKKGATRVIFSVAHGCRGRGVEADPSKRLERSGA